MRYQDTVSSICAADLKAGEFGVAVASTGLAVGKNVPFSGAFVGAIAVQGYTGPFFGIAGMKLLREGIPATRVLEEILADDPLRDNRQILIIDAAGQTAVFSGIALPPFSGARQGEGYVVGGCGLPGQGLLDAAAKAFDGAEGDLLARLFESLSAMSGAMRETAFSSAAIRISKNDPFPYIDLRVDSHHDPIAQLGRLIDLWRARTAPPAAPAPAPASTPAPNGAGGNGHGNGKGNGKAPGNAQA